MKLDIDQKELLEELTSTAAWEVLNKVIADVVAQMGEQVLKADAEDAKLALLQARFKGAQALANEIENLKNRLREKPNGRRK